jgi:DNA-binding Lrp family transcriptional regulator
MTDQIIKEREDLLDEIAKEFVTEIRQDGDISVQDLMAKTNYSEHTCRTRLNRMVKEGLMLQVKVKGKVGPVIVYRKI